MAKIERPNYRTYQDLAEALKRRAKRVNAPCWICGLPIDWDADYRAPMAYTYDHITPVAMGGKVRGPGRPAHR